MKSHYASPAEDESFGLCVVTMPNCFLVQVLQSNSRILVELARAHGDVCLFLKPSEGKTGIQALPLETDANDFSDLLSFQNRLSYDHIFTRGSGTYYIGVFNADHCLHETTYFNTTISIVNAQSSQSLCPLNCSFPQGVCIRDNDCHCEPGYGGSFCEGCECLIHVECSLGRSLVVPSEEDCLEDQLAQGCGGSISLMEAHLTLF